MQDGADVHRTSASGTALFLAAQVASRISLPPRFHSEKKYSFSAISLREKEKACFFLIAFDERVLVAAPGSWKGLPNVNSFGRNKGSVYFWDSSASTRTLRKSRNLLKKSGVGPDAVPRSPVQRHRCGARECVFVVNTT